MKPARAAKPDPIILPGGPGIVSYSAVVPAVASGLFDDRELVFNEQRATPSADPKICPDAELMTGDLGNQFLSSNQFVEAAWQAMAACLTEAERLSLRPEEFGAQVEIANVGGQESIHPAMISPLLCVNARAATICIACKPAEE